MLGRGVFTSSAERLAEGVGEPVAGFGHSCRFSGSWGRVAVNRQFVPGAVEHETNVLRGPKPVSEPTKRRKTGLNKEKGLGLGLLPTRIKKAVKGPRRKRLEASGFEKVCLICT